MREMKKKLRIAKDKIVAIIIYIKRLDSITQSLLNEHNKTRRLIKKTFKIAAKFKKKNNEKQVVKFGIYSDIAFKIVNVIVKSVEKTKKDFNVYFLKLARLIFRYQSDESIENFKQ